MNHDSYFEIGCSHLVCQDYAISGCIDDIHYAIVSDGCSSAPHSEIGAQVLCHVAKYYVETYARIGLFECLDLNMIANLLKVSICKRANEIQKIYPISPMALQATLMIATATPNELTIVAWGDGIIVTKESFVGGTPYYKITEIEYPTNAPFYITLDKKAYLMEHPDSKVLWKSHFYCDGTTELHDTREHEDFPPFISRMDIKESNGFVALCTDGLKSYQDENKKPVSFIDMAREVTNFASSDNNVFLTRNMNFLKRKILKKSWSHFDDLGCAVISL